MNWIPVAGVIPSPVEFGAVGGAAWPIVAAAVLVPVLLAVNGWLEIGIRESINALIDLAAPREAERRAA